MTLQGKNITVSTGQARVPAHLKITSMMVDDFLFDPVMAAYVIFGVKLDVFQAVRLRLYWWCPDVIDSSGLGTGKSFVFWLFMQLRCVLLGDQWVCAYYQRFESMKSIYWPYYDSFRGTAPLFAAQLGQINFEGDPDGKDELKGPACYKAHYRNESISFGPAPDWVRGATGQAGLTFNVAGVDEWTKVEAMAKSGKVVNEKGNVVSGIDQQVIGRVRRKCWNQDHPIWCNRRIFMATAESMAHPGYSNYAKHLKEVENGNPNFAVFSGCFKDFSNIPTETNIRFADVKTTQPDGEIVTERRLLSTRGKPFKQVVPDWKTLYTLNNRYTRAHWLREGCGIWARETQGVYSEDSVQRCVQAGLGSGLDPECGRSGGANTHYFMGIDPAPAQGKKADDGAMVILRARPKLGLGRAPTGNVSDWCPQFVWAMRVRGQLSVDEEKGVLYAQRTREWSGHIHRKHEHFQLTGILMDTQGMGQGIWPELNKSLQVINGNERECVPIGTPDDETIMSMNAHLILRLFLRKHLEELWPIMLPGVDSLYTAAHGELEAAIEHAEVQFPLPLNERPESTLASWEMERRAALNNLDEARKQLVDIQILTKENGEALLTRNNAKQYVSAGKKDLAYACLFAYIRFLMWLRTNDGEFDDEGDGEVGCFGVTTAR